MPDPGALPAWSDRWALFLDVDGTLLDIADHPDDVRTTPRLKLLVRRAGLELGGAVALVSGRAIADLDRLFMPLQLPTAGLHGIERRSADGTMHYRPALEDRLHDIKRELMEFADNRTGLLLEDKGAALALHYRNAPGAAGDAQEIMTRLARAAGEQFHVQHGKMVLELKPAGQDKGTAILQFMQEQPFAGRIPVFAGDDVTDEDGFVAVNRLGGESIRVGDGQSTDARHYVETVNQLLGWLEENLLGDQHGQLETDHVDA
ncbi:MAG: trehalose-phosphatase [Gammaproteobacteria bacterium]